LNRHLPELQLRLGDGHEDVERSVRFYQRDKALLRYRGVVSPTSAVLWVVNVGLYQ
jgi:hypothetical protein